MASVVHSSQSSAGRDPIQPMPPLEPDQLDALRQDIGAHGVLVPITVDQHGRVLDGNNRAAIAAELGVECPRVQVHVDDDDAAVDIAIRLNCARRHLTREQVREIIRSEIIRRPDDSDRAIARRVGCSPSTVGAVRKPAELSKLDIPLSREEAEELTAGIKDNLEKARAALYALVGTALTNHVSATEVIGALALARLNYQQRKDQVPDIRDFFVQQVYDYVIQVTSWPETLDQFPPHPDSDPTPAERAMLIESIVAMGNADHPADLVGAR